MDASPRPFGKYFLLEKIATGGMAEIYKAKTFGTDGFEKIVVIKKILSHWATDPEFVRMLIDEAKLSVLLNHTNIVGVFDLGSVESEYFIAMELVEGFDLKTLMNRVAEKGKTIPADAACFMAVQVAAGLDYAHKKTEGEGKPLGIIHRDISPHNILLSLNGEVKITDFGIAKATLKKSFTTTGVLKGKFSYMSPEQVRGETLTLQSDLFSLGVVLYEMLTGKKCFDGDTELAIIDKIRNAQIRKEDLPASIPEALRDVLHKALAGNLSDRYASADLMQRDLAQALAQIHPGFLPKDLSQFMQEYKKGSGAEVAFPASTISKASPVSSKSETNVSYIPGFQTAGASNVQKKKSSAWVWILGVLFILFGGLVGGGYAVWKKVIQPRMEARLHPSPPPVSPPPVTPPPVPTPPAIVSPPTAAIPTPESAPSAASPETAPSATSMGSIDLRSTPPGASIFVDDKDTGLKTPAVIPQIPLSIGHTITAKLEGYKKWEKPVTLINTTPLVIDIPLEKEALGQAMVLSTPEGADIFIDDQPTGFKTPATISNLTLGQPYRIRLMKNGFLPLEAVYTPNNSEVQRMDLPLREIPKASAPPARRRVYREGGGQPLRQTPPPRSPDGVLIVN